MKLTMGEVFAIRRNLSKGATLSSQAKKYKVSVSNIAAIKSFRSWKNVGTQFKDKLTKERKRGRKRKFSPETEQKIRDRYNSDEGLTQKELAQIYDASPYTIHNIIHRED